MLLLDETDNQINTMQENPDRNYQLFLRQKELLDTFLEHHAIEKAQYDKSLGDLIDKMGISVKDSDNET